jgi:hypothetical protein
MVGMIVETLIVSLPGPPSSWLLAMPADAHRTTLTLTAWQPALGVTGAAVSRMEAAHWAAEGDAVRDGKRGCVVLERAVGDLGGSCGSRGRRVDGDPHGLWGDDERRVDACAVQVGPPDAVTGAVSEIQCAVAPVVVRRVHGHPARLILAGLSGSDDKIRVGTEAVGLHGLSFIFLK